MGLEGKPEFKFARRQTLTQEDEVKDSVVNPSKPVDYSKTETPPSYKCGKCQATGCKLWRDYQTFLEHQSLLCATCAGQEQGKNVSDIDADGMRSSHYNRTDQIGWRIPAVPTEENDTFWGYTSVPEAGCEWWRRLPTLSEQARRAVKAIALIVIEHAKRQKYRGRNPAMAFQGENNPRKALALALKEA